MLSAVRGLDVTDTHQVRHSVHVQGCRWEIACALAGRSQLYAWLFARAKVLSGKCKSEVLYQRRFGCAWGGIEMKIPRPGCPVPVFNGPDQMGGKAVKQVEQSSR